MMESSKIRVFNWQSGSDEGEAGQSAGSVLVHQPGGTDLVQFDGPGDLLHPYNWPFPRKLAKSATLSFSTLTVALNSAIFSAAVTPFAQEFGVSHIVGTLGVSLYVLGFATGPIFWAPFSELQGRLWPIHIGMLGFATFSLGIASGKDVQTVLICRFWSGVFGASPMTVVAGVFVDMFDGKSRGAATTVFSMTVLMGPFMAPAIGGFIVDSSLGWRWTGWIASIMGFVGLLLNLAFLEETYPPTILTAKAAQLRKETGNWAFHSEQEELDIDLRQFLIQYLMRPLRLLLTEPMVFLVSLYLAFVYGLVYLFLTAYPIVFQELHGMSAGNGGLCYLGMVAGIVVGGLYLIFISQPAYRRRLVRNNNKALPEWRLPPSILGALSFSTGILWFGWTGYRADIHWMLPAASGFLTGMGVLVIFQQLTNYLIDSYIPVAASVLAGSAVIRSLCGASFPLFARAVFETLGINWAGTLLGGIAALGVPIPLIFYLNGARIRGRSTH